MNLTVPWSYPKSEEDMEFTVCLRAFKHAVQYVERYAVVGDEGKVRRKMRQRDKFQHRLVVMYYQRDLEADASMAALGDLTEKLEGALVIPRKED